ncbi:MAG TPA: ABC transporter substrate-binding protein [Xanthobacteraceae bacterium]|nr:ABC transporter substrate-binding protein [Xanthobacteraceae bacterium]
MNRRVSLLALGAMLLAAASATNAVAWTVKDAAGQTIEVSDASRIVTIGGAVTEIVFALGFGDKVIAIDITSTYPAEIKKLPTIGYMRALAPEGVISLGPSLVLAIEGSGPAEAIDVLSRATIPFVLIPEGTDEEAVLKKIRAVAQALGVPEKGEQLAKAVGEDMAAAKAMIAKAVTAERNAMFVLSTGNGTPTVAGKGTSVDGIFKLAKVANAMAAVHGFKPATPEATLAAQPQNIVMLLERTHALDENALFGMPAFAGTPAAKDKRLILIPSYFLSFGPRTGHAMRDLAAQIYPEANLPKLPPRPWTEAASTHSK